MTHIPLDSRADRLKNAADAKKALLAKFQSKPTVTDPLFEERAAMKAAELDRVRQERTDAKAAKKQAVVQAGLDAQDRVAAAAQAELDAKRSERKERKALTKSEAKEKRDARYAARKARQSAPRGMSAYGA